MKKAANQPKRFAQPGRGGSADLQHFSGASLQPASLLSETLQISFEKQSLSQHRSPSCTSGDSTVGLRNRAGAHVRQLRDATPCVAAVAVLLLGWAEVSLQTLPASKVGGQGKAEGAGAHPHAAGKRSERDVLAQPLRDHRCCSPQAEPPPATLRDTGRAQAAA